jgi:biopolymer transport protein ExbB
MSRFMYVVLLFITLSGILWATLPASSAFAQEAKAPAVANDAAPAADAKPAEQPSKSYVWWFIRSSGLIGLFILILSIYFVATVIRLFLEMRLDVAIPPELLTRFDDMLQRQEYAAIYNTARSDPSLFGRVLTTGLAELPSGLTDARDAMERMADTETVDMEKQISMLAVLGTLGPMIGLIGTLKGMITSFSVIAMSDVQLKASEVAGGISEALLLTFEGVGLSIPAIYFYAVFRNRVAMISSSVVLHADHILRRMAQAAKGKVIPAPEGPAASGVAPPPLRV